MPWWRVLSGKDGVEDHDSAVGHRRRTDERYPYRVSVAARCSSWSRFLELMTGDVSAGGIFVPTTESAEIGEAVELRLSLPDEGELQLRGTVVVVIDRKRAGKLGKPQGLGIQIERPTEPPATEEFEKVLARARALMPAAPDEIPTLGAEDSGELEGPAPDLGAPELAAAAAERTPAPEPVARPTHPPDLPAPEPAAPPPAQPAPEAAAPEVFSRTTSPEPILGIDLGTTYSSVAVAIDRRVVVLADSDESPSIATALSFPEPGRMIVGNAARRRLVLDPKHTIVSPKRILGRQFAERDVQQFLGRADYGSRAAADGTVSVEMWGEPYAIAQLCSYILAELRRIAEARLGREVRRAVIGVPVAFGPEQLAALRRAAALAHLEIAALIDEPTAAALANRASPEFGGVVAIYDFGGGTFDVSLVDVSSGDFRVLVTGGDGWLGGDDFDAALSNAVANELWRRHRVDVRERAVEHQRLLFAAEQAKRDLSVAPTALLHAKELLRGADGMMDVRMTIDRRTFRKLCEPVIEQSLQVVREAISRAAVRQRQLSTIYLSGGSTYMPSVRNALVETFGVPVRAGVAPEHATCVGAAIYGAMMRPRLPSHRD